MPPADWKAVHLLSAEEVQGLFADVVAGLAFLVSVLYSGHTVLQLILVVA